MVRKGAGDYNPGVSARPTNESADAEGLPEAADSSSPPARSRFHQGEFDDEPPGAYLKELSVGPGNAEVLLQTGRILYAKERLESAAAAYSSTWMLRARHMRLSTSGQSVTLTSPRCALRNRYM